MASPVENYQARGQGVSAKKQGSIKAVSGAAPGSGVWSDKFQEFKNDPAELCKNANLRPRPNVVLESPKSVVLLPKTGMMSEPRGKIILMSRREQTDKKPGMTGPTSDIRNVGVIKDQVPEVLEEKGIRPEGRRATLADCEEERTPRAGLWCYLPMDQMEAWRESIIEPDQSQLRRRVSLAVAAGRWHEVEALAKDDTSRRQLIEILSLKEDLRNQKSALVSHARDGLIREAMGANAEIRRIEREVGSICDSLDLERSCIIRGIWELWGSFLPLNDIHEAFRAVASRDSIVGNHRIDKWWDEGVLLWDEGRKRADTGRTKAYYYIGREKQEGDACSAARQRADAGRIQVSYYIGREEQEGDVQVSYYIGREEQEGDARSATRTTTSVG